MSEKAEFRSQRARRTGQIDPLLPFRIDPMNGRGMPPERPSGNTLRTRQFDTKRSIGFIERNSSSAPETAIGICPIPIALDWPMITFAPA
jgi:hypothetical protein